MLMKLSWLTCLPTLCMYQWIWICGCLIENIASRTTNFQTYDVILAGKRNPDIETNRSFSGRLLAEPDLRYQTSEEGAYLKYHRCYDEGEVYAAAYLITKEHLLNHETSYDLSKANTELASFIILDTKNPKSSIRSGTMTQSLDILDFSVIHLSAYERLMRRYNMPELESYSSIEASTKMLMKNAKSLVSGRRKEFSPMLNSTIAIMPWLGSEIGAGNSRLTHRQTFLKACFWSIYAIIPNVVIAVKNTKDYNFVR